MATQLIDGGGSDPIVEFLANGAGTEKARITSGGKVGIGTTSPSNMLRVSVGSAGGDPTGSQENVVLESDTNAYFSIVTPATATLAGYGISTAATVAKGGMFYSAASDYLMFRTNQTEQLRIDTNGKVGIGTMSPQNKLDINGGVAIGSYAGADSAPSNGLIVSGNVGIGTSSPTNPLSVNGFANFQTPAAQVALTGNQSIPASTETVMSWGTHLFDNDSLHSDSTNPSRLTAPVAGIWMIGCYIAWDSGSGAGYRLVSIRKNGGTYIAEDVRPAIMSVNIDMTVCTIYKLSANDYVEVTVEQTDSTAINVSETANSSFWMYKISD